MFEIQRVAGDLETWVLRDTASEAEVSVVPERGAIVSRFRVGGREVLYLDPATLVDRSKNVRGGIPLLFPIAGRLSGGQYRAGGTTYAMGQHGFARNLPFEIVGTDTDGRAAITLSLGSSEATRAVFPWEFEARITYALCGQGLSVELATRVKGPGTMPLHVGFHPYFLVHDADKGRAAITTDATRAFDNTTGLNGPFTGFDLKQAEVDLHLLDHHARTVRLSVGDRTAVTLEMDEAFSTLVVWTLAGKDFVCVEPWTAPGDALNTGERLVHVGVGGTHLARFRILAG